MARKYPWEIVAMTPEEMRLSKEERDVKEGIQKTMIDSAIAEHPLFPVLVAAIEQAMYGKGERHGGAVTPFFDQPWNHYSKMHGRGFLTGQAAKKLEEAASTREGKPFEQEVLGAIVYCGMSILAERAKQ